MIQKREVWFQEEWIPVRLRKEGGCYRVEFCQSAIIRPDGILEKLLERGAEIIRVKLEGGKAEVETDIPYTGNNKWFLAAALEQPRWFELGEELWHISRQDLAVANEIAKEAVVVWWDNRGYCVFYGRDKSRERCYRKEDAEELVRKIERESRIIQPHTSQGEGARFLIPETETAKQVVNLVATHNIRWNTMRVLGRMSLEDALARILARLL